MSTCKMLHDVLKSGARLGPNKLSTLRNMAGLHAVSASTWALPRLHGAGTVLSSQLASSRYSVQDYARLAAMATWGGLALPECRPGLLQKQHKKSSCVIAASRVQQNVVRRSVAVNGLPLVSPTTNSGTSLARPHQRRGRANKLQVSAVAAPDASPKVQVGEERSASSHAAANWRIWVHRSPSDVSG